LRIATAIRAFGFALLGSLLLLAMLASSRASAEPTSYTQQPRAQPRNAEERYFIEFRARPGAFIGHTYVAYGRTSAAGRILDQHYAGLLPDGNAWEGLLGPIPASVREYKADAKAKPDTVYRRPLSAGEYAMVSRAVRFLRNNERELHVVFQNCNDFGIVLAEALGLRRPPSLMPPSVWVSTLRALNE
jgi:hypothetical protein